MVSGARYALEEILEKAEKSNLPTEKWRLFMDIYKKQLAYEEAHGIALEHAKTYEEDQTKSPSSEGLEDAIKKYRAKLPEIEKEYKDYQLKYLRRNITHMTPDERDLRDMNLDELKRFFESDWGALKDFQREIENTERTIQNLRNPTPASTTKNKIEIRVELEINQIYLGDLKLAYADTERLYYKYVPPDQRAV